MSGVPARFRVVVGQGVVEALVPELLVAFDAADVDAEQDLDAVAGAAGDLGGRNRVESQGHTAVAEVIGAARER